MAPCGSPLGEEPRRRRWVLFALSFITVSATSGLVYGWPALRRNLLVAGGSTLSEEQLGANEPAEDLLTMDGMDRHLAYILASREIVTMEDLAEQGVEDLMDIPDMTEERAGELIMTARAPWFAEAEETAAAQE